MLGGEEISAGDDRPTRTGEPLAMRHAALLCLLIVAPTPARAGLWEWRRQPVSEHDRAEIRRVATLTSLSKCALEADAERQRDAFSQQALMQYNGLRPAPRVGTVGMGGIR